MSQGEAGSLAAIRRRNLAAQGPELLREAEAAGSLTSIMVQMSANSGGEIPAELVPIVRWAHLPDVKVSITVPMPCA